MVSGVDEGVLARLDALAKERKTSVEAIARDALVRESNRRTSSAATLTVEEKIAIVERMRATVRAATIAGMPQTPSLDLIREDRNR